HFPPILPLKKRSVLLYFPVGGAADVRVRPGRGPPRRLPAPIVRWAAAARRRPPAFTGGPTPPSVAQVPGSVIKRRRPRADGAQRRGPVSSALRRRRRRKTGKRGSMTRSFWRHYQTVQFRRRPAGPKAPRPRFPPRTAGGNIG